MPLLGGIMRDSQRGFEAMATAVKARVEALGGGDLRTAGCPTDQRSSGRRPGADIAPTGCIKWAFRFGPRALFAAEIVLSSVK